MSFFTDKQTLYDLNILGRYKNNSISRLFDTAITEGGKKLMDTMFQQPLTDAGEINKRSSIFNYFSRIPVSFPFSAQDFAVMEGYLSAYGGSLLSATIGIVRKKLLQVGAHMDDYELLNTEVCITIRLLNRFYEFAMTLPNEQSPYDDQREAIKRIFAHPKLSWLFALREVQKLPLAKLLHCNYWLRTRMHQEMTELIALIFQLDVYTAVGGVASREGFRYAQALPKENNILLVTNLYHPTVENAVGNNLSLHQNNNVIFLTGANMAGKSTLMKSFGIAVYLAHMGFPVAADEMEFSVKDGLYSSINVPDNLDLGYSHFYAEVLRVKTVAEQVAADKDLIVVFDELFKGTNVKDAYDATLSITAAFSENRNCFFIISSHIIEVGESLRQHFNNFRFAYLPTVMDGLIPRYSYKLTDGITSDKHGMRIIENEAILDIIRGKHFGPS